MKDDFNRSKAVIHDMSSFTRMKKSSIWMKLAPWTPCDGGRNNQPHVVPVAFQYDADADAIVVGGYDLSHTKKFHDAESNPRVAFVVDDLASIDPWIARGIEIRGRAQTFTEGGKQLGPEFGEAWLQIDPVRTVSWGINE